MEGLPHPHPQWLSLTLPLLLRSLHLAAPDLSVSLTTQVTLHEFCLCSKHCVLRAQAYVWHVVSLNTYC